MRTKITMLEEFGKMKWGKPEQESKMLRVNEYDTWAVGEVDELIEELEGCVSFTGEETDEEREALLKTALSSQDYADLLLLRELNEAAHEASDEWAHGEMAINQNYFVEYTKELILDCYDDIPQNRADANDWQIGRAHV